MKNVHGRMYQALKGIYCPCETYKHYLCSKIHSETSKNEAKNNSSGHKVNLLVQVVD